MSGIDAYLQEVQRGLAGMDSKVQRDILRELRSHLTDSAVMNGGNEGVAIAGFGEAIAVAKRYRELYGYSASFRALFMAAAGVLGFFSVPVLVAGNEGIFPLFFSSAFLAIEFVFLIWVSVNAGNRAGLFSGIVAVAGRSAGLIGALTLTAGSPFVTGEGLALFGLVCALLVLVGWIPGKAKQAWRRPAMDL